MLVKDALDDIDHIEEISSSTYQVLQTTLLVTVTGRVMVQGQSVMVRVVG